MAHLFDRQFMRKDLVPPREVWLGIIVLGTTIALCVSLVVHTRMDGFEPLFEIDEALLQRTASGKTLEPLTLPRFELANWSPARGVRVFSRDTLYEKINGRADLYLQYKFEQLTFATYLRDNDPDLNIEVWAYDMGAAENARGIFQAEQSEQPDPVDVGQGGYRSGDSIFFWKGSLYVNVMTLDDSLGEACLNLANKIAEGIQADASSDWFTIALPETNLVADSRGYEAEDAFSLGFLSNVYTASYPVEFDSAQQEVMHFVHQTESPAAAKEMLKRYTEFFGEYGEVLRESEGIVIGDGGGVIDAVFVAGRYFAGVSDVANVEVADLSAKAYRIQLKSILEQLP